MDRGTHWNSSSLPLIHRAGRKKDSPHMLTGLIDFSTPPRCEGPAEHSIKSICKYTKKEAWKA
jgi:hypothetical protein